MNINQIRNIPLFFIVGRPRTGSTLLRTLFDAHPNVVIPTEMPLLMALHHKFRNVKKWDKKNIITFYECLFTKLRFEQWSIREWYKFDKDLLLNNLLTLENQQPTFEDLFKTVYLHFNSFYPKTDILIIGDKNPVYSNQTDILAKLFPQAKFIHLTRDYRDNISSLLRTNFEMPNITLLAYRWKYSIQVISKVQIQYPDRFYTIKYEDLVTHPLPHFAELCKFLQIPYDNNVVNFQEKAAMIKQSLPPDFINKYFSSLLKPIDTQAVGVYKKDLSKKQIRIADMIVGNTASTAGYHRDYTHFSISEHLKVIPSLIYTKGLYGIGNLVKLLPYKWMIWLVNKPSIIVKYYSLLKKNKTT